MKLGKKKGINDAVTYLPVAQQKIWAETIGKAGGGACPPIEDGLLQLMPGRDGTDGFFIAVMQSRLR